MIIFLNLDGTAKKVVPERIFQGSSNVASIDVIAPYPPTTALEIAFSLPNATNTQYFPMAYVFNQTSSITAGVWTYSLPRSVTELVGEVSISINAMPASGNQTSYQCRFNVEKSILPTLPPEPEPDVYDLIVRYLQQNNYAIVGLNVEQGIQNSRINALENTMVRKVLVDFSVDAATGVGVKYYSDGTTATVQFSTGGITTTTVNHFVTVAEFNETSFVNGELAFSPMQTGQWSNDYIATIDKNDIKVYEVSTEERPITHKGVTQTANAVFKGSDGSALLSGFAKPFDGRLLIVGGGILAGGVFVIGLSYNPDTALLTITYVTSETQQIYLPKAKAQRFYASFLALDWQGETAPFTITIPQAVHDKGEHPAIITDSNTFGIAVNLEGDITLSAQVKKAFNIIIF